MNAAELEAIRGRHLNHRAITLPSLSEGFAAMADREALLAEVDRLRAEKDRLRAESAYLSRAVLILQANPDRILTEET